METATKKIECGKCNGKGEIPAFRGIAGGICFACAGAGSRTVKASHKPGRKFVCIYAGQELFTKTARTEAEALRLAVGHWKQNPTAPAFAGITEEQITVREG